MSKEFLVALLAMGGIGYFIYTKDPAHGKGSASPSMGGKAMVEVTPSNFQSQVIGNSRPVLAYYWAPW